ncbi:hypothetical protein [Variovorax boronicumulans]|uniref:hypothetical protein n=1 Tax=Variovorax boronicumulans TaxID=436515 RepID=UPI001C5921D5
MPDKPLLTTAQLRELFNEHKPEILNVLAMAGATYLGIQNIVRAAAPAIAAFVEAATPTLRALSRVDWPSVQKKLDELPERSRDAMKLAAASGWFFGWNDSLEDVFKLLDKLEASAAGSIDAATVDQVFEEYFTHNFDSIKSRLVAQYPARAQAIEAAAYAHLSHLFDGAYLSIPVFIAQADGLLSEIAQIKSVFQKTGREALEEKIAQWSAVDPEISGLLQPLIKFADLDLLLNPMQRDAKAAGGKFTALNRHQVMHGEVSDYGTRLNSLKAFSLLSFVGLHVPLVIESVLHTIASAAPPAPTVSSPELS